jgi:clorobiocin/coumermycin A biosynthesis protein CloN6/CouN6
VQGSKTRLFKTPNSSATRYLKAPIALPATLPILVKGDTNLPETVSVSQEVRARPFVSAASKHYTLKADLFFLHAPSVFDFRERDDLLFAHLSDSDSVNTTTIYEIYPLGLLSLKQRLREEGLRAEIVNLASLMLKHPSINVKGLVARLEAPVFGFDLHWLIHCHGALELAQLVKAVHQDSLVIFGGISSTYFAEELIRYDAVDVVVQGYDTLDVVARLMRAVTSGQRDFAKIPNLLYKSASSEIVSTGFTHKPMSHYNDATVDWSFYKNAKREKLFSGPVIMTLPNTGCAHDCGWCGGSRSAYHKIMGVRKTLITKSMGHVAEELRSMGDSAKKTAIYALQCYSESKARLYEYLDVVKEMGYKMVNFEQFRLPDQETVKRMVQSTRAFINLSPESHDPIISKLAGRGTYTMKQMEDWIERALDAGIAGVMVWFFIGMPRQTRESVLDTVRYCESLIRKFRGKNVVPLLCPMVPFLDPGSRYFEKPEQYGYHIFHRTLEQHRQALVAPLWHERLNYSTNWLARRELQETSYAAVAKLVSIKGELGMLPGSWCKAVLKTIEETKQLLAQIEQSVRAGGLGTDLRKQISTYNRKILAYSTDQIIPTPRPFGSRWFDDTTIPADMIADLTRAEPIQKTSNGYQPVKNGFRIA